MTLHSPLVPPSSATLAQAAFEARARALTMLRGIEAGARQMQQQMRPPTTAREIVAAAKMRESLQTLALAEELKFLPVADVYAFNAETEAAIMDAAQSIPLDVPLSAIETPNAGAGWFWLTTPLPVATAPDYSDTTHALLWGWATTICDGAEIPALMFSAYVDDQTPGVTSPSTRWHWPISLSYTDMLGFNRHMWQQIYGPQGPLDGRASGNLDHTIAAIGDLTRFFLMACVWFTQRVPILTREPGHIERHARKRYQREHKLDAPPRVHVVALRRSAAEPRADHDGDATTATGRVYTCRWIVRGHARLQACGPGRADRKLIWIDAHPAGPEDKPLRTRDRVYVVIR